MAEPAKKMEETGSKLEENPIVAALMEAGNAAPVQNSGSKPTVDLGLEDEVARNLPDATKKDPVVEKIAQPDLPDADTNKNTVVKQNTSEQNQPAAPIQQKPAVVEETKPTTKVSTDDKTLPKKDFQPLSEEFYRTIFYFSGMGSVIGSALSEGVYVNERNRKNAIDVEDVEKIVGTPKDEPVGTVLKARNQAQNLCGDMRSLQSLLDTIPTFTNTGESQPFFRRTDVDEPIHGHIYFQENPQVPHPHQFRNQVPETRKADEVNQPTGPRRREVPDGHVTPLDTSTTRSQRRERLESPYQPQSSSKFLQDLGIRDQFRNDGGQSWNGTFDTVYNNNRSFAESAGRDYYDYNPGTGGLDGRGSTGRQRGQHQGPSPSDCNSYRAPQSSLPFCDL